MTYYYTCLVATIEAKNMLWVADILIPWMLDEIPLDDCSIGTPVGFGVHHFHFPLCNVSLQIVEPRLSCHKYASPAAVPRVAHFNTKPTKPSLPPPYYTPINNMSPVTNLPPCSVCPEEECADNNDKF